MVPKWCPRAWCFWEGCPRFQNGERMFVPRVHFGNHFRSLDVPLVPKAGPNGVTFRRNPKKNIWKIDIKVYVEKEQTMRGKGFKTYVEIDVKIDDKSMRFRNLRFLDFCEEYNVKLLFSHDQGHQKSIKFQLLGSLNSDVFRGRVFGSIFIIFWEGFGRFWGAVDAQRLAWR